MLQTNIITVKTEQSRETDAGLTNEETIVITMEAKDVIILYTIMLRIVGTVGSPKQ